MNSRKVTEKNSSAPVEEQSICVSCGFCCDATLFHHAMLQPGERGHLPEKIEQNYRMVDGKEYFIQPCLYFDGTCTIYERKRAHICSAYRCQLLKDFAEGKITSEDTLETVREALGMRTKVIEEYLMISGKSGDINFRQILVELGKVQMSAAGEESLSIDYELFLARCNIFEALLIKNFRSAEDFDKMIMK